MPAKIKNFLLAATFFIFSVPAVYAQGGNSPYSILGVGDLMPKGNIVNQGMGGTGVSTPMPGYSNIANPANLSNNNITFFDFGFFGEYRSISDDDALQRDFGGNIMFAALGFPITRKWTSAVGLRPYTVVNSEITFTEKLPQTPTFVRYSYVYDGGITQAYWSNGIELFKGFSTGLEIAYNFGAINRSSRAQLEDGSATTIETFLERTSVSDFVFTPGINYFGNISENFYLSFGATYQFAADLNARSFQSLRRTDLANEVIAEDTLQNNIEGTVSLPSVATIGFSMGKQFKYTIAGELSLQSWSDYTGFNGEQPLADAMTMRFGGDFTPDITSVSSYFNRITYRAGVFYQQLPYQLAGNQIEEAGITAGFSLPVGRGLSSMNLAVVYGVRGYNVDDLISEEYIKFSFGITVNDRLWFVRRRIN